MRVLIMVYTMLVGIGISQASDGLCGMWQMNEASGERVADSSGHQNTAVGSGFSWARGINSSSVRIQGDGGVLRVAHDPELTPSSALTVDFWVAPWNPNYTHQPGLVMKKGAYGVRFLKDKRLAFSLWIKGEEHQLLSTRSNWPNGEWVYIAATFDGSVARLYVDGELDAQLQLAGSVDRAESDLYFGSVEGASRFINSMDEVRLFSRAVAEEELKQYFDEKKYEVERYDARFSAFFEKNVKRQPREVVPSYIWIDAEDFDAYGGWWLDNQFVAQMGSPFLMAAGTGDPVEDATTTIEVERAGTFRLWVRSRNWIQEYSPGRFEVWVNGERSATTFGTAASDAWVWQSGGTFDLEAGEVALTLHDLTGYFGRCDALLLTRDMNYTPPASLAGYKGERRRLCDVDMTETTVGTFDVIVVGGGIAGINAAISSARTGAKTALIQNRPMVGGNNSLEMGVPILGPSDYGKKNARESGLNEEIGRLRSYHFKRKWSQAAEPVMAAEEHLTLFLNTHVYDVERGAENRILAVKAFHTLDGSLTRYEGRQFIDCTGDGWLGYYAGSQVMRGREPHWMFDEKHAPEEGDIITMSGTLFQGNICGYSSKDMGEPVSFVAPEWAWDLTFNTTNLQARKRVENTYRSGTWWHENRNTVDDLWDPEAARDGLLRVGISYWNWIKNHSNMAELAAHRKLIPLPITSARRETRRLVGEHILTETEVMKATLFEDRVCYGGWGLDVHHPDAIFSTEGPFDYNAWVPMYSIPFRSLYSKNIPNLLFAGRNISVSHVALGSVRVQGTTGVMGQAVGTAAAMCVANGLDPHGLYEHNLSDLQQQLLKDDQFILGVRNEDPADLALTAAVRASSELSPSYSAWNVISGMARILEEETHMWASDTSGTPQWLELEWEEEAALNSIYLTFDTDLNDKNRHTENLPDTQRMPPECVRDYRVQIREKGMWKTVAEVKGNFQRRRIHRFATCETDGVRIEVEATNGDPSARVYEVRCYHE